jgi:hypothetical protein
MEAIPSYLRSTAYGQRVKRALQLSSSLPDASSSDINAATTLVPKTTAPASATTAGHKNSSVPELPQQWVCRSTDSLVTVSSDGTTIDYKTDSSPSTKEIRTLLSDHPVPAACGVYYYEVELISALHDGMVGIGFYNGEPSSTAGLTKMPGMEAGSWGYHSDDGKVLLFYPPPGIRNNDLPLTMALGPVFGKGDTIGCGLDLIDERIFYTKNGIYLDLVVNNIFLEGTKNGSEIMIPNPSNIRRAKPNINAFFPCVGFKPIVHLQTNFGGGRWQGSFSKQQKQAPRQFLFDIDQYVEKKRIKVLDSIRSSDLGLPPLVTPSPSASTALLVAKGLRSDEQRKQEEDEKRRLIRRLISSYFAYLGYVDTAKEFDREGTQLFNQPAEQESFLENAEVVNRQRIGKLITNGLIDEAFASLREFYPEVLAEPDSLVVFKLECCKFIELIRSTITMSCAANISSTPGAGVGIDGDTEMRDITPEEDDDKLDEAIAYGQQLRNKYKNDTRPFVQTRLSLVFSLLAYQDPAAQDSSLSFLLDVAERVKLSEEVNAKILVSIGKPSIPPLQKLVKQVMAMVWELQDQGTRPDSNLVDVERHFL